MDFEFRVRTSAGLESVNLGRSVEPEFENWYRSSSSTAFGSSFLYMQSFVVQGDTTAIESVIITLTNAQGSDIVQRNSVFELRPQSLLPKCRFRPLSALSATQSSVYFFVIHCFRPKHLISI